MALTFAVTVRALPDYAEARWSNSRQQKADPSLTREAITLQSTSCAHRTGMEPPERGGDAAGTALYVHPGCVTSCPVRGL